MTIYSHSRLSAFETCPRKYWYAYIEQPEIERVDIIEFFLGSRVHDALEELYRQVLGGRMMSSEGLVAWYEAKWDREWHDGVRIVKEGQLSEDYRRLGCEWLRRYHLRYHPFDQSRTVDLEMHVRFALDSAGRYEMQGYIDRLSRRADGTYEIRDYKTSARIASPAQADKDRQLALYQIGLLNILADVREVDLIWHFVRFDREIRSRRSPEQLEQVKGRCIATIDDIESRGPHEKNFPASSRWLCRWCDFMSICPEAQTG